MNGFRPAQTFLCLLAFGGALLIQACGGGGGSASSTPSQTTSPTTPANPSPTPLPAPTAIALSYPSAAPWYSVGSAITAQKPTLSTAGTYAFTITDGALPPGLSLNADGSLTGTPAQAGVFTFTISASTATSLGSVPLTATVEDNQALTAQYAWPSLATGNASPNLVPIIGCATP
ncbi:MAG TPA: Ig domain-containing protein [Holophaga sp.]|jgi:hypothetical protein|nr:Ig domain-containing protein [Holophaga sp.]